MSMISRVLVAMIAGTALLLPLASMAGPDEAQKAIIQKTQEAKQKLNAAETASGGERQKMMEEHMKMMQEMMAQMQKAKPGAAMTPTQMREWIDEHLKLMNEMMGQMMQEHHMMMQNMGMSGMGKK